MESVVIVGAARTPIGSFLGNLSDIAAPRLGAIAIRAVLERANIASEDVSDVIMGHVLQGGTGQAPARQACLFAGLPNRVRCLTVNKVCSSGLKAVGLARSALLLGEADIVVAGGMETMSLAPHVLLNARKGLRLGHGNLIDLMIHDGLWDPYNDYHMGNAAELCAREYQFSREAQDAYAIQSYERAQLALANGWFKEEVVPVEHPKKGFIAEDEEPTRVKFEKIPTLRPVFEKEGTITPANASTINDGAAAVVLMREQTAIERGCPILARITGEATVAQAPEWFTTAPGGAIRTLLGKINLSVDEVESWEINEAFSVVAMAAIKDLEIDPKRLNSSGGAVALGHPIGASGCRLLVTLIHSLKRLNQKHGIVSLCNGGGEAVAMSIERE